jgi:hypothetical protein
VTHCHVCGNKIPEHSRSLKLSGHSSISVRFAGNLFDLSDPERQLIQIITDALSEFEAHQKAGLAGTDNRDSADSKNEGKGE